MKTTATPAPEDLLTLIHEARLFDLPALDPSEEPSGTAFAPLRLLLAVLGFDADGTAAQARQHHTAQKAVLRDRLYLNHPHLRALN